MTFDGVNSDQRTIVCGVPEGSILGPLLFLININEIANSTTSFLSLLYADDNNLFRTGKNLEELFSVMNSEIYKLVDWLNVYKLKLNIKNKSIGTRCKYPSAPKSVRHAYQ